jgi:tRNA pseudouridine38-40 synthase
LSHGDEIGVATPLPALTDAQPEKRWTALLACARQHRVTDIVIGHPLNMDDSIGFKAREVERFAARLKAALGLPVHLVDERLTSHEAQATIPKSKRRAARASGRIDSRAATLILQDFLDQTLARASSSASVPSDLSDLSDRSVRSTPSSTPVTPSVPTATPSASSPSALSLASLPDLTSATSALTLAPTAPPTPRWKCLCAYDGAPFAGWQSQRGGGAIQDIIEARIKTIFGRPIRIHASGRTDAGVHARGQVFHFDAPWRHGAAKLRAALGAGLPRAIQIKTVREAPATFHARFSATGKIYTYHIHLGDPDPFTRPYVWACARPLDLAAMQAAAAALRGRHDFRAFSAHRASPRATTARGHRDTAGHQTAAHAPPRENTVRELRQLDVTRHGARIRVTAWADGFLYKMVRSLVGALAAAGEGKMTPAQIRELLATGTRPPKLPTAPPQGLFLERVLYPRPLPE